MTIVRTTRLLDEQIMDELMDAPSSIFSLAAGLAASDETVRRAIRRLEAQGLIYASGTHSTGPYRAHVLYAMARTRKAA